jgi:hypothetical protein
VQMSATERAPLVMKGLVANGRPQLLILGLVLAATSSCGAHTDLRSATRPSPDVALGRARAAFAAARTFHLHVAFEGGSLGMDADVVRGQGTTARTWDGTEVIEVGSDVYERSALSRSYLERTGRDPQGWVLLDIRASTPWPDLAAVVSCQMARSGLLSWGPSTRIRGHAVDEIVLRQRDPASATLQFFIAADRPEYPLRIVEKGGTGLSATPGPDCPTANSAGSSAVEPVAVASTTDLSGFNFPVTIARPSPVYAGASNH